MKSFANILVVTTMLLTFIGQALAYTAMPCNMMDCDHHKSMMMEHSSMDDMSNMNHSIMGEQSSDTSDCCDIDCDCPTQACSSVSVFHSEYSLFKIEESSEAINFFNSVTPISYSKSLYRPPIIT
ncbi:hypothetical protein [Colwellia sp. UCD-KL20]|uniref:hypothetical protein n=1 Tax=Colwellia sp. UCD-KL20 TaxID=1917165 RepID=UPI0011782626|nr:hypothetical protein [Colwellia sp. UCD-KL20]